jgi:hypothetical protein
MARVIRGLIYMTNKTSIVFGLCLMGAISYDMFMNDGANIIFLGQKGLELIELIAFWR